MSFDEREDLVAFVVVCVLLQVSTISSGNILLGLASMRPIVKDSLQP